MVAVTATVGSGSFTKQFVDTSTADKWDGNILLDSISSQSIGILLPNIVIDNICVQADSSTVAWRLQNAQTLLVRARGFGSAVGVPVVGDCSIPPLKLGQNDILTAYTQAADTGANDTVGLIWVETDRTTELFTVNTEADNTATEATSAVNAQSLGDTFFGSTLKSICVQQEVGATVNAADIVDDAGGVIATWYGSVRNATGAASNYFNLDVRGLGIKIGKGFKLRIYATTA